MKLIRGTRKKSRSDDADGVVHSRIVEGEKQRQAVFITAKLRLRGAKFFENERTVPLFSQGGGTEKRSLNNPLGTKGGFIHILTSRRATLPKSKTCRGMGSWETLTSSSTITRQISAEDCIWYKGLCLGVVSKNKGTFV